VDAVTTTREDLMAKDEELDVTMPELELTVPVKGGDPRRYTIRYGTGRPPAPTGPPPPAPPKDKGKGA
jgi:hypothetical protein